MDAKLQRVATKSFFIIEFVLFIILIAGVIVQVRIARNGYNEIYHHLWNVAGISAIVSLIAILTSILAVSIFCIIGGRA